MLPPRPLSYEITGWPTFCRPRSGLRAAELLDDAAAELPLDQVGPGEHVGRRQVTGRWLAIGGVRLIRVRPPGVSSRGRAGRRGVPRVAVLAALAALRCAR